MQNRNEDRRTATIEQHTHEGPRTGQTSTDEWVMTCGTCGVNFVEGMEDMTHQEVIEMMTILYGS
ncbi:hypothetical protein SEA_BOGOTA_1 [Streptomyces phage Bogota]|jgi:hypothetical protein|nr:hypothetical protein SEA_BOGOTA_1 [Streptomyces phage Bogota]